LSTNGESNQGRIVFGEEVLASSFKLPKICFVELMEPFGSQSFSGPINHVKGRGALVHHVQVGLSDFSGSGLNGFQSFHFKFKNDLNMNEDLAQIKTAEPASEIVESPIHELYY
jgi:hypothetical protein